MGLLLAKLVVVAWRNPVPKVQAAEHMEAREETRKYYLRVCDWNRAAAAAALARSVLLVALDDEDGFIINAVLLAPLAQLVVPV